MVAPGRVAEQLEIDETLGGARLDREEQDAEDRGDARQAEDERAGPAELVALGDEDLQRDHGDHEGHHAGEVELVITLGFGLAVRGALDHQQADHGNDDRREEDVTPSEVLRHEAAEQRTDAGTAPRADGPQAHRALTRRAIPVGLNQRQAGRHDAGRRQPCRARPVSRKAVARSPGRQADQQRAQHVQEEADLHDLQAADAVGEAADHHDEDAGEQRRDRHRDVHHAGVQPEILLHVGRHVQGRLGKQPERDHTHDDAE
jgi:hypothetical protein